MKREQKEEKAKEVKHSDPYDARIKQLEERILELEATKKELSAKNDEFEKRLSVLEKKNKGVV